MWQPQGFYNEYVLSTPALLLGEGSIRGLYNYPAAKVAVIHGGAFHDMELFRSTFSRSDIKFIRRSWAGEPDLENIQGTLRELEDFRPDTVIAAGGGSVIDGSKICRLLLEVPYYRPGETRLSGEQLKTRFIAVPTTVGSGAEVSSAAVFVDHDSHRKDMVVMHELRPSVVVYDKRYVANAPVRLLAASAVDAMAHILEGYASNRNNAYLDVLAEKGLAILHGELEKFMEGNVVPVDHQRLQFAGCIGGLVQNHCIVGAAHAVAHQLTEYGYSHGEAVALLLPAVIRLNSENGDTRSRYRSVGAQAGFSDEEDIASFIGEVCAFSGIEERKDGLRSLLRQLEESEDFRNNVKNDKGGKGNPVEITDDYIRRLVGSI